MNPGNAAMAPEAPGAIVTACLVPAQAVDVAIMTRGTNRLLPVANAALAAPAGGCRLGACWCRCPYCGGQHLHRATAQGDLDGAVRAGCGRPYKIRVKRVHRPVVTS